MTKNGKLLRRKMAIGHSRAKKSRSKTRVKNSLTNADATLHKKLKELLAMKS